MKTAKKIRLYDLLILGALTSVSLLSSCQKKLDTELSASDGMLRFEVSDAPQWQEGNTAASKAEPIDSASLKVQKIGDVWEDGQQMYLHTSVEPMGTIPQATQADSMNEVSSKGTVINPGTFHNSIGIFGIAYSGTLPTRFTPSFMTNVKATGDGTGEATTSSTNFQTATKYYIPYGKTVKLYAVAPYNPTGVELPTSSTTFESSRPSYRVTVQDYVANQPDLCFAEATVNSGGNGTTSLNFEHVMAAVRFDVASSVPTCKIVSIALKNVISEGTVTPGATNGYWTYSETRKNFTYNNGGKGISHTTGSQTNVFGNGIAFFMIPQSKDNITLEIVVQVNNGPQRTLTTTLPANWVRGNRYNYTLSFTPEDPTTFEVTTTSGGGVTWTTSNNETIGTVSEPGGTYTFNVSSKKGTANRAYRVEYRTSTTGDWTVLPENSTTLLIGQSTSSTNLNGGDGTHTFKVYQQYTINSTQTNTLKGKAEVGSSGREKSLDTDDQLRTTSSNCYVVSAPGYYSFGTYYGNAIVANQQVDNLMGKYKDYNGNTINTYYMNGSRAQVLWTDVPNLVTNVKVEGRHLTFQVPKATIQEGNAVIGLLDGSGVCMWSWHIWVTPDALSTQAIENVPNNKTTQYVLKRPIGYVNAGTANWRQGTLYVRFVQSDGSGGWNTSNAKQFTIKQTGAQKVPTPGRYPVYQWGRKDPLWPMAATHTGAAQDAPVYPGPSGNTNFIPSLQAISGSPSVRDLIRNPHKPYAGQVTEALFNTTALWDASPNAQTSIVNNYSTIKSIYDPSPTGFKVAPPGTFDAFCHNGYNYFGGIKTPINAQTPQGGYGSGKKYALNYGVVDANSKIIYCYISGSSTTFPIPLLGGRAFADNWQASGVSSRFYTWYSSRRNAKGYLDGCSLGIYATDYTCWVDLYGMSNQEESQPLAGFNQQHMANAFPILPVAQ